MTIKNKILKLLQVTVFTTATVTLGGCPNAYGASLKEVIPSEQEIEGNLPVLCLVAIDNVNHAIREVTTGEYLWELQDAYKLHEVALRAIAYECPEDSVYSQDAYNTEEDFLMYYAKRLQNYDYKR